MIDDTHKIEPFERKPFPFRSTVQQGNDILVKLHWHEHIEFIKVLEGTVDIILGNETFRAEKDDIVYVGSSKAHSVRSSCGFFCAIKGIVFDKNFLTSIVEGFETKHVYSLFIHTETFGYKFPSSHPLWYELNRCIENSYQEFIAKDICYEMSIKSNIYRLISSLLRHYKKEVLRRDDFIKASNELMRLKPAFDYIDANYSGKIYIKDLGDTVNMSPDYFTKYFKKITGKTPTEYIADVRINMAIRLILDTSLSITEISEKAGFCNINYFDKMFRESTGLTPTEYRNNKLYGSIEGTKEFFHDSRRFNDFT